MIRVFIGGTGRSGTSIMKKVLACHPQVVAYPFELRVNVDPGGILDLGHSLVENWSPYSGDSALKAFLQLMDDVRKSGRSQLVERRVCSAFNFSPRRYPSLGFENHLGGAFQEAIERFVSDLSSAESAGFWAGTPAYTRSPAIFETKCLNWPKFAKAATEFMDALHAPLVPSIDAMGQHAWVDDTPYSVLHADQLHRVYPDMKLIHVYRDPRDVLASYRTKNWGSGDVRLIASRIAEVYRRWFAVREQLPANAYCEVELEQLSASPEVELKRIMEYINLPYDASIQQLDLSRTNAGRWKKDLSQSEVDLANDFLIGAIAHYDYSS